jgi:ElaB/YqjD/DUF883 family membrane-anchored ribosome-binding protein
MKSKDQIRMINKTKENMYKHLKEFKDDPSKKLKKLKENTNKTLTKTRKTMQDMKQAFNKDIEILEFKNST